MKYKAFQLWLMDKNKQLGADTFLAKSMRLFEKRDNLKAKGLNKEAIDVCEPIYYKHRGVSIMDIMKEMEKNGELLDFNTLKFDERKAMAPNVLEIEDNPSE